MANLISCDRLASKVYVYNGITSTITDSFTTPLTLSLFPSPDSQPMDMGMDEGQGC